MNLKEETDFMIYPHQDIIQHNDRRQRRGSSGRRGREPPIQLVRLWSEPQAYLRAEQPTPALRHGPGSTKPEREAGGRQGKEEKTRK